MRLVMMGTGTFAEPTFEALLQGPYPVVGLVTQPDRAAGQERGSTRQTGRGMKTIAAERGVLTFQPEKINTPEGVARLRELEPDLLVVAAYGQILSKDVLAVPAHGGINIHGSLLPRYRGAAPVAWAIYNGEIETGVTIIKMSVSLDAGEILARESISIGPMETAGDVEARLAPLGARLATQVIDQLAAGITTGVKQDQALVTRAPKLTKEHGLIDWARTAQQVCNQVRAMQPWPTAYTFLHRQGQQPARLIVCKTTSFGAATGDACKPGDAAFPAESSGRLLVAAGNNTLVEILELQPAGKKRMPATEFLRGHRLQRGDRFGPETSR
jgi:methionyl-tRNA formyltransferase